MRGKWIRWSIGGVIVALLVAATIYALLPRPVAVDIATVEHGPMQVTIDEDGTARIRNVFRVSAPISGRLDRLPVHLGDKVYANSTEVARLRPTEPGFLDTRTRQELQAAVEAAQAGVTLAEAQLSGALAGQKVARAAFERAQQLSKVGTISVSAFDQASAAVDTADAEVEQARAQLNLRESELSSARARLIEPTPGAASASGVLTVRAPVTGVVLKVISESEQVVAAGTPLVEIGDPEDMEVVVPLLSTDAAAIAPDTLAVVDGWGGPALAAKVRSIDPAAYTKVSALGIEEQRVDVTLDLTDKYEVRKRLGHGFRVRVHLTIWRSGDVLRVPLAALFRQGSDWAVYRVVDGHAALTVVSIDHRNAANAEVTAGLKSGDTVVLHPSDTISDGTLLEAR